MHESALSGHASKAGPPRGPAAASVPAAASTRAGAVDRWLRAIASLKLTAVLIVALAIAIAWSFETDVPATYSLAAPLVLLAANLLAAIATHPTFRHQAALLVFHVGLIAVLLLIAIGRLTYLQGRVELSQGEWFDGVIDARQAGPWHPGDVSRVAFTHDGFEIDYAPGLRRGPTRNPIRWRDEDGVTRRVVIGDQVPLTMHGYRFYTSANKGFAPRFVWMPAVGAPVRGTVHLPPYPVFQFGQEVEWNLPGSSTPVHIRLEDASMLIDPWASGTFRKPSDPRLTIEIDGEVHRLRPGEHTALAGGTLHYEELSTWMGYTVHYDRTIHWLLAASLLSVGALAWHLRLRFLRHPWAPA